MVKEFVFSNSPTIIFGKGKIEELPPAILKYGQNVLLVTGAASFYDTEYWHLLISNLEALQVQYFHWIIQEEPSPEMIDDCINKFGNLNPDVIVAIGGGSVLDAGKAISAMWIKKEPVIYYLEGVGDGRKHDGNKIPFIAVPTTSGTGSEATKNAVISKIGYDGFKKSLRHNNFIPDLALIDPGLMISSPPDITAWSGMDAFTQLLESYLSTNSNPLTDGIAFSGFEMISNYLIRAVENGNDTEARTGMAYATLCSGITLANSGLGTIHGFASSIGARFKISHGIICGKLMGASNEATLNKLLKEDPTNIAIKKYSNVGRLFHGSYDMDEVFYAEFLINKIHDLDLLFDLPKLSLRGFDIEHIDEVVSNTSNKNNPIQFSEEELKSILEKVI